jgi:hypothetical protein
MLSPEIIREISKLQTREDCREAWNLIKMKFSGIEHAEALSFVVGQKVWFMSRKIGGVRVEGTVIRINKKSISVHTDSMGKWNVAPSLLSPCEVKSKTA